MDEHHKIVSADDWLKARLEQLHPELSGDGRGNHTASRAVVGGDGYARHHWPSFAVATCWDASTTAPELIDPRDSSGGPAPPVVARSGTCLMNSDAMTLMIETGTATRNI